MMPETCPWCSEPKAKTDEDGDYHYLCGSWASMQQGSFRSHRCKDAEIARLAARVADLEEALENVINSGKPNQVDHPSMWKAWLKARLVMEAKP